MKQELLQRLDALAAKLGVAAEHLWEVLIVQARVEVVNTLVLTVVAGLLCYPVYRLVKWAWRADEEAAMFLGAVLVMTLFLMGIVVLIGLIQIPTQLWNPEYWAFTKVLKLLMEGK